MAENGKKAKATSTPRKARKTAKAEVIPMPAPAHAPTHDEIADLARKYWAERGFGDGHHEDDWFRAEQELRAKAS